MNVIETILRAANSVTNDLADGANSVRALRERQGEQIPYIVVTQDLVNPNDTTSGQSMDEWEVQVYIVSDRRTTDGAKKGAYSIGENVRAALHGVSGTHDDESVNDIKYNRQSHQRFNSTNEVRIQVEQTYTMWINR